MTCSLIPLWKSCNFLSINYYEQISDTFEECLSEALIPEANFLNTENSLFLINDSHKTPWKREHYDSEFLLCESKKIDDTLSELDNNEFDLPDPFCGFSFKDNFVTDFDDKFPLEEKNFDSFSEDFPEQCKFLDIPPISFTLMTHKPKFPPLSKLLEKLPFMEIEDVFEKEIEFPMENIDVYLKSDEFDNIESSFEEEMKNYALEELQFLDLPLNNVDCYEKNNSTNFKRNNENNLFRNNMEETWCEADTISGDKLFLEKNSSMIVEEGNYICSASIPERNILNVKQEKLEKSFNSIEIIKRSPFKEHSKNLSSLNENEILNNNNKNHNAEIIESDVCLTKQSKVENHNNTMNFSDCEEVDYVYNNSFNRNSNIVHAEICTEDSHQKLEVKELNLKENPASYENAGFIDAASLKSINMEIEDDLFDQFQNVNEFESDPQNISIVNSSNIMEYCQDLNINNELQELNDNLALLSEKTQNYIEKISNLNYNFTHEDNKMKEIHKSSTTAFRTGNGNLLTSKNSSASCAKRPSKQSKFQNVNLLSTFLGIKNNTISSPGSSGSSLCQTRSPSKHLDLKSSSIIQKVIGKQQSQESQEVAKNSSPEHFSIEDLQVILPDDYITTVLLYESAAIPILKFLMRSSQFQFPSNFTITDIHSYKTCFLLNQEIKCCKDEGVNPVNGTRGEYYKNLLRLHGILKSLECCLSFDAQLAINILNDFEKSHNSILKGCYRNLMQKLSDIVPKLNKLYSVHPKLKELCKFLMGKYYFYKDNNFSFKALIIVKKNLNSFYASFESVLKEDLLELNIILIPESIFLQPSTLIFKNCEDSVYVVNASSLSKNIPWKQLNLVIEYEEDFKSQWKQICSEQEVLHAFIKLSTLPLKSLEEIKIMYISENSEVIPPQKKFVIVVSSTITSQFDLHYLLKSKLNIKLCERNYQDILFDLHFADIAVDEKTAIILIKEILFKETDYVKHLYDRITFIHRKYEICWIIVEETKEKKKSSPVKSYKESIWEFYFAVCNFCKKEKLYTVKIVYAMTILEIVQLIQNIASLSSRNATKFYDWMSIENIFKEHMTKEEIFLVSFPSINPFVANLLLSEASFPELLKMSSNQMFKKFPTVPEHILQHFYSSLEKEYKYINNIAPTSRQNLTELNEKFEEIPDSQKSFYFSPILNNSAGDSYDDTEINEEELNLSPEFCRKQLHGQVISPERSLEELDLDYMSLKLSYNYENITYDPNINSVSAESDYMFTKSQSPAPSDDNFMLTKSQRLASSETTYMFSNSQSHDELKDSQYMFKHAKPLSNLSNFPITQTRQEDNKNFEYTIESIKNVSNPFPHTTLKRSTPKCFSHSPKCNIYSKDPLLFFNNYTKEPNKRKYSFVDCIDENNRNDLRHLSSSPATKKSCRIQKGLSSKTVTKMDLFQQSPLDSQHSSVSQPETAAENSFFENGDIHPISKSIPMTPRTARKLAFEGAKGQTKLVFI